MPRVLTMRADFLAANKGLRNARVGFVLLTRPNGNKGVRYGITVTKKIGNAVVRNRMKRRFRELLRDALPGHVPWLVSIFILSPIQPVKRWR